jgi:hypothetical protein
MLGQVQHVSLFTISLEFMRYLCSIDNYRCHGSLFAVLVNLLTWGFCMNMFHLSFYRPVKSPVSVAMLSCILILGISILPLTGCGGGGGSNLSAPQQQIQDFNTAAVTFQKAMRKIAATAEEMQQFLPDENRMGMPTMSQEQLEQQAILLERWDMEYRSAFVAAYEMVMNAQAMESEQMVNGLWFDLPGENLEQTLQAELFTLTGIALLTVGVAISTWTINKFIRKGLTKACREIKNIILVTNNQACLEAYAGVLKMSQVVGVEKQAILDHMENHPNRASLCTAASFAIIPVVESEDMIGANCQTPSAADLTSTRYEVMQDVTEAGAGYSVSNMTAVTSTVTSVIVQGSSLSEGAKTAAELGISLTDTAMAEYGPSLPPDVTVVGVSESTTSEELPPSSGTSTPAQGISAIMDSQSGADAVREAFADAVGELANVANIPIVSNSIDVPNNIFVGEYGVNGLTEDVVVPIPNIGFATVMVLSPQTVPEVTEQVDTTQNSTIDFNGIGVSQWGEEPKKQDNIPPDNFGTDLTVTGLPGSVAPGTDVTLTVDCPAEVAFPATLDSNTFSGVSLVWSSFSSCPFSVVFNADSVGTYNVQLTLTDSNGKKWLGGISISVAEGQGGIGTWPDPTSGLTWQNPPEAYLGWAESKAYCAALALDGGGWHMPSISELRTLIRGCPNTVTGGACGITDSCLAPSCVDGLVCSGPDLCLVGSGPADGIYWPAGLFWPVGVQKDYYWVWSSSRFENESSGVVIIDFKRGHVHGLTDNSIAVVRCVR